MLSGPYPSDRTNNSAGHPKHNQFPVVVIRASCNAPEQFKYVSSMLSHYKNNLRRSGSLSLFTARFFHSVRVASLQCDVKQKMPNYGVSQGFAGSRVRDSCVAYRMRIASGADSVDIAAGTVVL